jgi:hypothetical protein
MLHGMQVQIDYYLAVGLIDQAKCNESKMLAQQALSILLLLCHFPFINRLPCASAGLETLGGQ